jgi:hypothetical protein
MLVLALPWGAVLLAQEPAGQRSFIDGSSQNMVLVAEGNHETAAASILRPTKKCRIATLSGVACVADIVLLSTISTAPPEVSVASRLSVREIERSGLAVAPDTGPPRFI